MVHHEKAYIRHYKRKDNKNNRILKSVEVRGLKTNTKFKDKEKIIILSEKDFINLNNELEEMQKTNNDLLEEQTNQDNKISHDNILLYNKLFYLMEIINNRNELLIKTNNELNNIIDVIIKAIEKEYNIIIDKNNEIIKDNIKTDLKAIVNICNIKQTQKNIIINNEIEKIQNELLKVNGQINNMSLLEFLRVRKKFNFNIDFSRLKEINKNNNMDLQKILNLDLDNLILNPDFKNIDYVNIKEISKNQININDLYIKLDHEENI